MLAAEPHAFSQDNLNRIFARCRGHLALAVSGGSDSIALMRLAARWGGAEKISVQTVDHGLRAASAGEARQVGEWALALGLDHHVLTWAGEKPVTGIQAKARAARYGLLEAWCREHGADLLTAHTIEDQAETVLMRMARSTSLDGLAGIAPERGFGSAGFQSASFDGAEASGLEARAPRIIRPLLNTTRERLRAYLNSLGQPWIDDPSNDDTRFERVRIRKAMADLNVGAAALAHVADEARAATAALWGAADHWVRAHVQHFAEGYGAAPLDGLAGLDGAIRARALGLLVARYGARGVPEPHERQLLAEWLQSGDGARRTLGGAEIAQRRKSVLFGREPGRISAVPLIIPANGKALWDRRFAISAPAGSNIVPSASLRQSRRPELPAFVQAALPVAQKDGRMLDATEWHLSFTTH